MLAYLTNSHKPLAREYAVSYDDPWCCAFVSAVAIKAELTDIIPIECGCEKQIALFKNIGRWIEDDNCVPSPGDIVFYDWGDNGIGDNKGYADHVGIVTAVDTNAKTITVIEGNKGNAVSYRTLAINGKFIRGFALPDYASKATAVETTDTATTSTTYEPTVTEPSTDANATTVPYYIKIKAAALNVRKGPGTNYAVVKTLINDKNTYTIVEEADGPGASKWCKLKSGIGWLAKDYIRVY